MTKSKETWTNEQVEMIIGNLLRAGVILAAAVVFAGGVSYLLHYGATDPDYRIFRGEPSDLRSLSGTAADAAALRSRGLIQLGLLLLIATPIARVAFSIFAFLKQGDHTYVFVTLVVLTVLLYSFFGGRL